MNDNGFNSGVEYTRIPVDHVDSYLPYANVQNAGSNNQSNVQLATNISRNGSTVYNGTSNSASLMLANTSGFFSPTNTYSPTQLGTYTYTNTISQTETDATPANNSSSSTFEVTPGEYALDNNMPDGNYQGSGVGYSVGNGYEMFSTSNVRSVSAYIDGQTTIGTEVKAELFTMNIQGNFISVAESNPYLVTSDDLNSWVTLSINGGYTTSSGQILFAFFSQDFGTPGNMVISSAQQNFANTSFSLDGSTTFQLFFVPMVRLQTWKPNHRKQSKPNRSNLRRCLRWFPFGFGFGRYREFILPLAGKWKHRRNNPKPSPTCARALTPCRLLTTMELCQFKRSSFQHQIQLVSALCRMTLLVTVFVTVLSQSMATVVQDHWPIRLTTALLFRRVDLSVIYVRERIRF